MRRADREITEWKDKMDVLRRAETIRLGIHGDPYPYVVPMSFGYEDAEPNVHIYIHGANQGHKHSLLAKNSHVCVEAGIFHGYADTGMGLTAQYESVIGFGGAEVLRGGEAVRGLDLICAHCGFDGYEYDVGMLDRMLVYRITLRGLTGKRRFV